MSTHATAAVILACTLGGLLAGSLVRYLLPDHHTRDDSKDVMKTAAGMMATLVALIIGLLVSSAKGTFDATTASITQGGAKIITLDRVLAKYGPDAAGARGALRHAVAAGVERIWPADRAAGRDLPGAAAATGMEDVFDLVRGLTPRDDAQQYLKSQAVQLSADLMQSRWMLVEQSQNEMPAVFLGVLTAWLAVLFAGLGLLAPRNPTAYGALAVCAASMAGAVYLILELSHPLDGVIQVSGAPLHKALSVLGK